MRIIKKALEFDWDKVNIEKNLKHNVSDKESEEPFWDTNKIIYKDVFHSQKEERFIIIGKTKKERLLYTVFTYRKNNIRIISSRNINKKEVSIYEKKTRTAKVQK